MLKKLSTIHYVQIDRCLL